MPTVPCYQIIDTICNCDGNVTSVFSRLLGNRPGFDQLLRQFRGFFGGVEQGDGLQRFQTILGRVCVAGAGFVDDEF